MTDRARDITRGYTGPSRTWSYEDAATLLLRELQADRLRREARARRKRERKVKR